MSKENKIKALGKNLILEKILAPKLSSIIIASDEEAPKWVPGKGIIVSVGEEVKGLKSGDTILFREHYKEDVEEYWVVNIDNIIALC